MARVLAVAAAAILALCLAPRPASAAPGLLVGVADDYLKTEPSRAAAFVHDLGLDAVRLTIDWRPGQTSVAPADAAELSGAIAAVGGVRVFVAVYSHVADEAPKTPDARAQYCSTLADLIARFPQLAGVIVWNEPNKSTFWKPQFAADGTSAAPRAYLELLAQCYRQLHALRPSLVVAHAGLSSTGNDRPDAQSNISHSPGNFVRKEGEAYRALFPDAASGPQLYDVFGLHAYGESSLEPPWESHAASSTIALGDIAKLVQALHDAFAGTGQPVPGGGSAGRVPAGIASVAGGIAIFENGYQTQVLDPGLGYVGSENVPVVAPRLADTAPPPRTQSEQLVDAVRVAYCNPYVVAYFNFLLRDDDDLGRWQSGVLWRTWAAKPAYAAFKQVIQQVHARTVDCSGLPASAIGPFVAKQGVTVKRVEWPKARSFNWKNDLWRFRIQTDEPARYVARLRRVRSAGQTGCSAATVMTTSGELRRLYLTIVKFPGRRLAAGRYRMQITLTSLENASRTTTLCGPVFAVQERPAR